MRRLAWWFRVVGAFYVLLGVLNSPLVSPRTLAQSFPFDAPIGGSAHRLLVDIDLLFGLDIGVSGAVLLWASRAPWERRALATLVLWLELVRGIADDCIWIARGYPPLGYVIFILIHVAILATGIDALRRARKEAKA